MEITYTHVVQTSPYSATLITATSSEDAVIKTLKEGKHIEQPIKVFTLSDEPEEFDVSMDFKVVRRS